MKKYDVVDEMLGNVTLMKDKKTVYPILLDIHPVMNGCNLNCDWCIGASAKKNKMVKLNYEKIKPVFESIYRNDKRDYWPREIHFCGNNSEPLLNLDFIKKTTDFLCEKSDIKIITNGLLLNTCFDIIRKINKVNVSLDVTNANDFVKYKHGKKDDFEKILRNIKEINFIKKRLQIKNPVIYVSFVISDKNFNYGNFNSLCQTLKDIGVNHVQVRKDYYNDLLSEDEVKDQVVAVAKALGAYQDYIYYGDEDENTFDIKFNEKADRLKFSFIECKALWFWPTIAANGIVYPCAHKANEDNTYLGICLENLENYYEWIEEHIKVWKIKCDTPHLCPSNLNYLNSKFIGV